MGNDKAELRIVSVALTDVGHRRERNEDAILALPDHGIFCLADGMGGAVGGQEASSQIVQCVEQGADELDGELPAEGVLKAIYRANRLIHEKARSMNAIGMGSTVVALTLGEDGRTARLMHAGDSRAYLCRGGELQRLTRDHTLAAEIGLGDDEDVPGFLDGMLTRAIGLVPRVDLVDQTIELQPGDLYLLCSDGLNKHLRDDEIGARLSRFPSTEVMALAEDLVTETKNRGAYDNVSVILVGLLGE